MRYWTKGRGQCPSKECVKAVVDRKEHPAQGAERRQVCLLGEVGGRPGEGGKGQTRLCLDDHVIGLYLYSKSRGKPLMVLSRSQHEEICYEAFSLAVMEKMNWGVSCSVCWGAS